LQLEYGYLYQQHGEVWVLGTHNSNFQHAYSISAHTIWYTRYFTVSQKKLERYD